MKKTFYKNKMYKAGTRLITNAILVPKGGYKFSYYIYSNKWPANEDAVSVLMTVSFDKGKTWPFVRGFTAGKGHAFDEYLVSVEKRGMKKVIPEPENKNRKVRLTIDILKDFEFSDELEII